MICPKCNATLPDDNAFCHFCGAEILSKPTPKVEEPAPEVEEPAPEVPTHSVHFCVYCGKPLDPVSGTCPRCTKKPKHSLRWLPIALTAVILLLVGLSVFLFTESNRLKALLQAQQAEVASLQQELLEAEAEQEKMLTHRQDELEALQEQIIEQQATIDTFQNEIYALERKVSNKQASIDSLQAEVDFWENRKDAYYFFLLYAEVIPDDGTNLYHKYGCSRLDTSKYSFQIYNSANAENSFIECPHCH